MGWVGYCCGADLKTNRPRRTQRRAWHRTRAFFSLCSNTHTNVQKSPTWRLNKHETGGVAHEEFWETIHSGKINTWKTITGKNAKKNNESSHTQVDKKEKNSGDTVCNITKSQSEIGPEPSDEKQPEHTWKQNHKKISWNFIRSLHKQSAVCHHRLPDPANPKWLFTRIILFYNMCLAQPDTYNQDLSGIKGCQNHCLPQIPVVSHWFTVHNVGLNS